MHLDEYLHKQRVVLQKRNCKWRELESFLWWAVGRLGFPGSSVVKNMPANAGDTETRFNPWVRKIPWSRKWQQHSSSLTMRSWTGVPGGLQSMGRKELDMAEHTHTQPSPFVLEKILYLSTKTIHYTNILEKIIWNKKQLTLCTAKDGQRHKRTMQNYLNLLFICNIVHSCTFMGLFWGVGYFIYIYLATQCGMQNLSSLARNGTCAIKP